MWYTVMEVATYGIFAFVARHLLAAAVRRMVRWDVFETKLRRNGCTSMGCGVAHYAQMNQRSRPKFGRCSAGQGPVSGVLL